MQLRSNLSLLVGKFPYNIRAIPEASLGGILISRVLHFYNPNEVMTILSKCYQYLRRG